MHPSRVDRLVGCCLYLVVILTLIVPGAVTPRPARAADEFDALRDRWEFLLTCTDTYNPSDPVFAATIERLTAQVEVFWKSMDTSATRTRLWSDLASTTRSSDMTNSYGRLRLMARVYAARGSALEGNPALRNDLLSALDWMYTNRYNETRNISDSWWDWEIGTPLHLNNILVLLYYDLGTTRITNYTNAIKRFVPDPRYRLNSTLAETGANLVWKVTVTAVQGVVNKDEQRIASARDALSPVFDYVTSGDGFYTDGSFIQHERHPYTGGYGKSLLGELSSMMFLLEGSAWDITDPDVANVYRWVYDSFEPLIYRGAMLDMVRGREISRFDLQDHVAGHQTIQAILRLAEIAPPEDALRLKRMLKSWITTDTYYDFFNYAAVPMLVLGKQIVNDPNLAPRPELVTHRQFPNMDRVAHFRPGYGVGLSMSSQRIFNYESINGENVRGWYTADGMTYLYNDDLGQYSDDYWATVNPYRLPGTTVDTLHRGSTSINYAQDYRSPATWVGGAQIDGLYGVAGMDLKASGDLNASGTVKTPSTLTAKKAWFMFDDEVVALGAGISSTDNRAIETVVENRKLNPAGDNPLVINGAVKPGTLGWGETTSAARWAHLQGTGGYYFPTAPTIKALREARTGAWRDINAGGPTGDITHNYLNLWLDHGSNPTNVGYAYVLLPNKSVAETEQYSANPNISIVKNTPRVQAVRETNRGLFGATFWQIGTAEYLKAFSPAAVIVREEASALAVAVSDPTQQQTRLVFEVAKAGVSVISRDPSVTVTQLTPTIRFEVDVTGARGHSHELKVTFDPSAPSSKPTVQQLAPVADAFVRSGIYGTLNYGSDPSLIVSNAGGDYTRQAYLKFDLRSVSGEIDSAELGLYGTVTDAKGTLKDQRFVAVADDGWTETGLTFNTKPATGEVVASEMFDSTARWHLIDLTGYMRDQHRLDQTASLAVVQDGTGLFTNINSKENSSNRPFLRVTSYAFSPAQLASVRLTGAPVALKPGETAQISVSGTLEDGTPANLGAATISYRSAVSTVATVDPNGQISGVGYGVTTITVDVTLRGISQSAAIEVPVVAWGPLTSTIVPSADAFVRSGIYETINYGSAQALVVSNASGDYTRRSYLKFDLDALDGRISSAKLVINAAVVDNAGSSKEHQIFAVDDDSWLEGTLTYVNRPSFGSLLTTGTVTNTFTWYELDVTDWVRAQQAGDATVSLAIAQDGPGLYTEIRSRESTLSPYLRITAYGFDELDLQAVSLSATPDVLAIGETTQLEVTGSLEYDVAADLSNAEISYRSDTPAVANVDANGLVTAQSHGKARITADVTLRGVTKSTSIQIKVPLSRQTFTYAPVADAFVRSGIYGTLNYGSDPSLIVSNAGGDYTRQAYLKFDLRNLIVEGEIDTVQFAVYGAVTDAKGTTKEQLVATVADDGWTETGITWNSRPVTGATVARETFNSTAAWHLIDLTAYVRDQHAADGRVSLAIVQDGAGLFTNINSKENSSNRPYLRITTYTYRPSDTTAPSITCNTPVAEWQAEDASVICRASDAESGLADANDTEFALQTSVVAGTETTNAATDVRQVCDRAGNCATAGPVPGNKVDKKAPTLTIAAPTATTYTLNQRIMADWSCSDGGSGVAMYNGAIAAGDAIETGAVGRHVLTISATDRVGNETRTTIPYTVSYRITALYDQTKVHKSGSTVPIKLQLADAATANHSSAAISLTAVEVVKVSEDAPGELVPPSNANPDNTFRYDSALNGYIYNLKTTGLTTGTYALRVRAGNDPTTHTVQFQIR
jgi:hypothetical protein